MSLGAPKRPARLYGALTRKDQLRRRFLAAELSLRAPRLVWIVFLPVRVVLMFVRVNNASLLCSSF